MSALVVESGKRNSGLGLPTSPTRPRRSARTHYCDDGDLEIDNHGAERSLRRVLVGRKRLDVLQQR